MKYSTWSEILLFRWSVKKTTTAKTLTHSVTIDNNNNKAHNDTWDKTILKQTITKRRKSAKRNKRKPKIWLNNQKVV